MAIIDIPRRSVMAKRSGGYVSDRRLYLDKDNNVVEADSKDKVSLLIRAGGTIPEEDARRYGLIKDEAVEGQAAQGKSTSDASEDGGDSTDLESLTIPQLRKEAEKRGVELKSSMNKADIIEAIEAGPQEDNAESDE